MTDPRDPIPLFAEQDVYAVMFLKDNKIVIKIEGLQSRVIISITKEGVEIETRTTSKYKI